MEYKGKLNAEQVKFLLVVSRFNEVITKSLKEGAIDCIEQMGGNRDNIDIAHVPGSYEIPLVAQKGAKSGKYDAIIGIGAIIRGETAHFDFVSSQSASGILNVSLATEIPIVYGILTTDTLEQAFARAGAKQGNKGYEAAQTAIEMVNLLKEFR